MFTLPKNPKIPKNMPHSYAEQFLIEKQNTGITSYNLDTLRDDYLMEYCPRFCKYLKLKAKMNPKTISALKRIKKVTIVDDCFPTRVKIGIENQWRLILQNKFKSVESYNDAFNLRSSIKKRKVFSQLTTLSLHNVSDPEEESEVQELCAYFWRWQLRHLAGLVNLKFLDVQIQYSEDLIVLKKLNSLSRLLSSLKTFKITYEIYSNVYEEVAFLPTIIECKNLLQYITYLKIGSISEEEDCAIFKQLPKRCKNLSFLAFGVWEKVSSNYLLKLAEFEKLEGIKIFVEDLPTFMESFIAPNSLKSANICLKKTPCKDLCQTLFSVNLASFLKNPKNPEISKKIERFSQQFKNLNSLEIRTQDKPEEAYPMLLLIAVTFLQDIQNLQNLNLNIFNRKFSLPGPIKATTFSLASLFNMIPNITQQLKSFTLEVPRTYSLNFESKQKSQNIVLPQLKSFELTAHISSVQETMKKIFTTFPDQKISIKLDVAIVSNQDLIGLLQAARDLSKKTKINLIIKIHELDFKNFDKEFQGFLNEKKNASLAENVMLEVQTSVVFPQASWDLLKEVFKIFTKVSLG